MVTKVVPRVVDEGATPNPIQVAPYYPYPLDPLGESTILGYTLRAEAAANEAEASAAAAAASAAEAAAEADRAEAEADRAQAIADELTALFESFPLGTTTILNNQPIATGFIVTSGNPLVLDADVSASYIINFEVKRSVDLDERQDAYTIVFQYSNAVWNANQTAHAVSTTDCEVYFSITTSPGSKIGIIQYTSSDMIGVNYQSTVKYKGQVFA